MEKSSAKWCSKFLFAELAELELNEEVLFCVSLNDHFVRYFKPYTCVFEM